MSEPEMGVKLADLPSPETMISYAKILRKPKRDNDGIVRHHGEIIEAAAKALELCAALTTAPASVQEPVAWRYCRWDGHWMSWMDAKKHPIDDYEIPPGSPVEWAYAPVAPAEDASS